MDNCGSPHSTTASVLEKLKKIHISSSTDSDYDSDFDQTHSSDSELDFLSTVVFPYQYKLPRQNHLVVHSSKNHTLMDRMAASNQSIRMKHGMTALDVIVPLNRDTTTPLNSGTTQRNPTTPFKRGTIRYVATTPLKSSTVRHNTTKQLNKIPEHNVLPGSSFYVPAQRMFPSPSSSYTTSASYRFQVPTPSLRSKFSAPPYSPPPPYTAPSNKSQTSKFSKRSQISVPSYPAPSYPPPTDHSSSSMPINMSRSSAMPNTSQTSRYYKRELCPIPPYRFPSSCPPYTSQVSLPIYTSQSSVTSNTSQTFTSSIKSQSSASFYRPKYPTPTESPPTSTTSNASQTSTYTRNTQSSTPSYRHQYYIPTESPSSSKSIYSSQTTMYSKMNKSSAPSYRPQYPTPPDSPLSSMPIYTSQTSMTSTNVSQTSTDYRRTQSSVQSYRPKYPLPTDSTPSSEPIYTTLYSTIPNTSQTSTYSIRSQSSIPSRGLLYSIPPCNSKSSMPIYITPQSSSQTYTSRPSTSSSNFMSPSICTNPQSAHYNASPSYSHYTFPRSVHYTMPVLGTYSRVMPQSSNKKPYKLSVYEPSNNVWPTKIGSVMQASMENIWSVLATELLKVLPPSNTVRLKKASGPSTTARTDKNASLPPITPRTNNPHLQDVDPQLSVSTVTASNSCAGNYNEQSEVKCVPLYMYVASKTDIQYNNVQLDLQKAWVYFSKMEIIDIMPNGEIKCICPMLKFEDLLKSSINDKFMLVKLYRKYKANNLLFETTYDYKSLPKKTIVTEKMEMEILHWLMTKEMEDYDWFFNSLSFLEIENINPTNIQKFITRSKSNKTISLEDQLKICCMVKTVKERPVSLLAISMNLQENRIDKRLFTKIVMPYIMSLLNFPLSSQTHIIDELEKDCITVIMRILLIDIIKLFTIGWDTDTNIPTMEDLSRKLMASSDIICMNQLLTEFNLNYKKIKNKILKDYAKQDGKIET